ncbi:hypothetical protein K457DRAFT_131724 [Linnemannia elongata AG-77]|uniref:Cleavage/polyadenylation specificity factor A subunit N-terminal domain-containing protein n=1 Tax=Linnemannia elongata AG-77 TaxID=1314771 RepID=A0A197KIS0_9FUNG|nr:hypothetical protein K457DRAFT_131724 [Linnemannia elongata AG-77]
MEEDNHDSYESMEDESQEDYESMEEDSHDSYEELEDEILESNAAMEVDSVGDHSSIEDWEPRSDNLPLMDDEDSNNTNSNVWVYAKHLQTPGAFQQVCLGQWAPNELKESKESDGFRKLAHTDVVLGKGSYISLCRFTEYEADYPSGSWESIHEQHVFGTIKDLKSVSIDFEDEEYDLDQETAASCYNKRPRMGYLPELASKSLLVATSDNGFLTFLAFHYDTERQKPEDRGHFYAVKKIDIAEPGHDFSEMGAKIALDPTSNMMAVSGIQGHVKLFFLRKTKRSSFDPIEMISSVEVEGTIIAMDFLYVDRNATLVTAILGVLYFNKASGKHYISTFHIGPSHLDQEPPIYVGTSEIGSSHLLSVLLLKGLPDLPYCMVYVDEESITYVTTEQLTAPSGTTTINHTHHKPLKLMKKESRVDRGTKDDADDPKDTYPLISACATPPRSSSLDGQQTLYLGSDSADFFRVNINGHNNTMYFELDAGDRPIGRVLEVIGGGRSIVHQRTEQGPNQPLHTDFLLYSSEHGNGNILGVKEEEEGTISVFAVSELLNDAPVLDFCAHEPTLPGRDSLYACSGMKSEGCIKRVRSGILVESSGSSGLQLFDGATGVWSVKAKRKDTFDSFLVVSFIRSTKLMRVSEQGEFEDISDHCGLEHSQTTLAAGRFTDGHLFQVHRTGVVVVCPRTGDKYEWTPGDGVLTSASWAKEGTLVLGKISPGGYSLIVLELARNSGDPKAKAKAKVASASHSFRVITLKSVNAEPTTIYCWTESSPVQSATDLGDVSTEVLCCVGTLEPAIYLFRIRQENIEEVYTESLAQRREDVAVPHSIAVLKNDEGLQRILVGLRNGSIVVYEWNQLRHPDHLHSSPSIPGRTMSLPRLFNLGIMPVKFAYSDEPLLSRTLILSDKIWQANFDNEFEVQPILFDNEVSEACAFESQDSGYPTRPGFVCIVDHQDLQLLTLKGKRKYDSQSLPLGHTPRRLLDVTSEGLLLAASVGDGFPFAESVLQLIDPKRVSSEPGPETQHVVAELPIKQGEGVFCLAEWKLPNKVLICVGTGIFSPTGAAASAASPRTGRLIILSIRHSKSRGYGLVEEWAMDMSLPVFAISPFFDNKILVSTGPVLKLFAISSSESSLVEKANARERWPIVQISSQGKMIVTGSRGESINFYEYEAGNGEHSFDKLKFFKSARSARQVSDCLAISPELAVGVDLSGSVFGVGYTPGVVDRQYSLVDQFSFHVGEIVSRIRLAKLWKDDGRSLAGIPLPRSVLKDTVSPTSIALTRLPSFVSLLRPFILIPWSPFDSDEPSTDIATPTTKTTRPSSQALIGFSIVGSILGFWRLTPQLYDILKALQQAMTTFYDSRPVLGPSHGAYRSQNQPTKGFHTIDGNLIDRFLALDHVVQIEVVDCAIRLEGMIEEWIRNCDVDSDVAGSGGGGDGVLGAALEREFRTTICGDDCATGRKCVDHANLRRSLYLNDKGRPIDADRLEGDDVGDKGSSWRQEGNGRPVDVIRVPCRTIHVLCSVLRFLRSLDWHQ